MEDESSELDTSSLRDTIDGSLNQGFESNSGYGFEDNDYLQEEAPQEEPEEEEEQLRQEDTPADSEELPEAEVVLSAKTLSDRHLPV